MDDNHWVLIEVDIHNMKFRYYNSMQCGDNSVPVLPIAVEQIQRYLNDEIKQNKFLPGVSCNVTDWEVEVIKDIPLQSDCINCIRFICKYALCICDNIKIEFAYD